MHFLKAAAATLVLAATATTATEFMGLDATAYATTARGSSVTTTYYTDKACTQKGGGPPGLVSNPFKATVGNCRKLLSSGFSIEIVECGGGSHTASLYPARCNGIKTVPQKAPTGVCIDQGGLYQMATCN